MSHKFEGFTDGISAEKLNFISSVLINQGFSDGTVVMQPVGKAGDNYGSDVRRIIVEKNDKSFRMVAKIKIQQKHSFDTIDVSAASFHNEHLMYTKVLPKYTEFEKQAGIPESKRLVYAKVYGALLEEPNVMILFEDLQVAGYNTFDRYKPLPHDAIKVILKTIANLHAYAFVLKHREPTTLEAFKNKLYNLWELLSQDDHLEPMFENIETDILFAIDDEKYQDFIKYKVSKLPDIITEIAKEDCEAENYVIQHGDAWTNNVMFKLQDERIMSCCMVDYQGSRAASPASDVSYLIFNCTDYEGRVKYYHHWIDYYHSQLDRTLSCFDLKANSIYSKERLTADMKRYGKLSLPLSAFTMTFIVRDNTEAAEIKKAMGEDTDLTRMFEASKIMNSNSSTVAKFRGIVKGIIDSHVVLGLV